MNLNKARERHNSVETYTLCTNQMQATSITRVSLTLPVNPWLLAIPDVPDRPHRYQICDEALSMKGSGNLVLCTHITRSGPVTWLLHRNRLLVGPLNDFLFFWVSLYDGPVVVLSYFAQVCTM